MAIKIQLYNNLTKTKEEFKSINDNIVTMYHCGPTVYDEPHIGNMRSYVFADILRRMFEANKYTVKQVINITDVGHIVSDMDEGIDKIEKAVKEKGLKAKEISEFYTKIFMQNLHDLNIKTVNTHFPKATEYIEEQRIMIQNIIDNGFAYKAKDAIYFDVIKYNKLGGKYGILGDINLDGLEGGIRINIGDKKSNFDFALWKYSDIKEKRDQEWFLKFDNIENDNRAGYPGWHIECSAMSYALLGAHIDIHTGGVDHIPVHHNNEIAQSKACCAIHDINYKNDEGYENINDIKNNNILNSKTFANIWMHNAHINFKNGKMSKSDGRDNYITIEDLKNKGIKPLYYKYFLLQTKYNTPIFFEIEDIISSGIAYERLKNKISIIYKNDFNNNVDNADNYFDNVYDVDNTKNENIQIENIKAEILENISNDLNTSKVIAYIHDIIKDHSVYFKNKNIFKDFIIFIDDLLGLDFETIFYNDNNINNHNNLNGNNYDHANNQNTIDQKIIDLAEKRKLYKDQKNFIEADNIRAELKVLGYDILDKKNNEYDIIKL